MGSSRSGGPASRRWRALRADNRGFALVLALVVLTALYLGATGIFLAARAELRIGINHAASNQAFYLAEAGLATWLASEVQPSAVDYEIGGDSVAVRATAILRVDSATVVYRVTAQASVGGPGPADPGRSTRQTSVLGRRIDHGPVRAVVRTWREVF